MFQNSRFHHQAARRCSDNHNNNNNNNNRLPVVPGSGLLAPHKLRNNSSNKVNSAEEVHSGRPIPRPPRSPSLLLEAYLGLLRSHKRCQSRNRRPEQRTMDGKR